MWLSGLPAAALHPYPEFLVSCTFSKIFSVCLLGFCACSNLMYHSLFFSSPPFFFLFFIVEGEVEVEVRAVAMEMQVDKGNYLNTYRAGLTGLETQIKMQRSM